MEELVATARLYLGSRQVGSVSDRLLRGITSYLSSCRLTSTYSRQTCSTSYRLTSYRQTCYRNPYL
jgi:hypothetical protein